MSGAGRAERPVGRAHRLAARTALAAGGALLAAAALLALAAPASAHAVFVSASPGPGADLAAAPAEIRIAFSEPLMAALSGVEVDRSTGARVGTTPGHVDGADAAAYVQPLPQLGPGRYTVVWHTTSKIDGHVRWGSYGFTVLEADGAVPPGPPPPRSSLPAPLPVAISAVTSWVGLAALFALTGAVLALLLGGVADATSQRLLGRLVAAAAGATALATAAQFAGTWAGTGWRAAGVPAMISGEAAAWWWLRLAATVVAAVAWPRRPTREGGGRRTLLATTVLAAVLAVAATGHPAAGALPRAGLAFAAVHVLAASLWLGGVVAVAIVWIGAWRRGADHAVRRAFVRRFSVVAGMAVPAVLASGVASAVLELGGTGDLTGSGYGRWLLVKAGLVALTVAVAAGNAARHRARGSPREAPRRVAMWLGTEAVLGLLVLAPTAALSVLAPSGATDAARAAARQAQHAADPVSAFTGLGAMGTRTVEVALTPGTAGVNDVRVEVDGDLATSRLQATLTSASAAIRARLARSGLDHDPATHTVFDGSVTVPGAGRWELTVSGAPGMSAAISVAVRAPPPPTSHASPVRDGWLLVLAVLGGTAVLMGAVRVVRPRRSEE
ncbi:MAG: hypothetical protein EPN43_11195, partial [Jatrophihabitans sp.]